MIFKKDVKVRQWILPAGFQSDGCTFPGILKYLRGIMKADEYSLGCALHDFLRRYAVVSVPEADKELRQYIYEEKGDRIRSYLYWLAVKFIRNRYTSTLQLPTQWEQYRNKV